MLARTQALIACLGSLLLATPAAPAAAPAQRSAEPSRIVTYLGFRPEAGGAALVFADVTGKPAVEVSGLGTTTIRYRLVDTRVTLQNNTNPLLAEHFGTAVRSARLLPDKAAVVLTLELRSPVKPTHELVDNEAGGVTLRIQVPAERR